MMYGKMKVVEIFKTNVSTEKEARDTTRSLLRLYPIYKINFDLEDEENILRVEAHKLKVETAEIIKYMIELGYNCERIE
ncbi:methyltransferase type 11 [Sphingobacterium thalpophilum]|uniref:Methyltransferase type 11 n=1 Tax=Sphingobacterium thalpophilum TaxID=259 RepID=A0ABV4HCM8_9SPHI|nr:MULTISPECIES: methyltransferase type 11 [unclassified Sphingobacterium]